MLLFNVMEQDNHGYSVSQIMWGQEMNLPTNLVYVTEMSGKGDRSKDVKDLAKELRETRKRVAPFNQAARGPVANLFWEGDLILIYQQQMENTHKLSPHWRGPFNIIEIPNPFQVIYNDQGREKITHVSNCKKFQGRLVVAGIQAPPLGDAIPKQKKCVNQMNLPSSRHKMTLCHFEVCVGGITHVFDSPHCFHLWLQGDEDTSTARGEVVSQEVADFFFKELRLVPLPG